jgi:hypothetical protein
METDAAGSTVEGGGGSTAWEVHGLQAAHQAGYKVVVIRAARWERQRVQYERRRRGRVGRVDGGFGVAITSTQTQSSA